jgi:tRNA A37 methylthiotransferase MiaB
MRGHVAEDVKKTRSARLHDLARTMERRYNEQFIGAILPVLWEQVTGSTEDGFVNVGYTDSYIRVRCIHPRPLANTITPARLDAYDVETQQMETTPVLEPIVRED